MYDMGVVHVHVCTQPWESVVTFHLGSLLSAVVCNILAGCRASRDPLSLLPPQWWEHRDLRHELPRSFPRVPGIHTHVLMCVQQILCPPSISPAHIPSLTISWNSLEIGMTASYERLVTKETTGSDTSRAHSLSPEYNTGQVPRLP